jgi:acetyl-CoA C-acetyltransferase
MTRVEGACASSSLAVYEATYALEAGRYRHVLVLGVEKMTLLDAEGVARTLARCSYEPEEGGKGMTFPGLFASLARAYSARHRVGEAELARMLATVTALAYRNGAANPLAHFGPDGRPARQSLFDAAAILALSSDGREDNPMVAPPLRLHDCSPVSDGAAALVLSGALGAKGEPGRSVRVAGIGHAVERFPLSRRDRPWVLEAAQAARDKAFAEAGIVIADVGVAEVHDCFTINALLCVEALGLAEEGRAGYDYVGGRFGREDLCPVNLSGGLKAKGHPVGATGASMHVLLYRQLIGNPIGLAPATAPEVGVLLNVGGAAVTNCVTVLRRD